MYHIDVKICSISISKALTINPPTSGLPSTTKKSILKATSISKKPKSNPITSSRVPSHHHSMTIIIIIIQNSPSFGANNTNNWNQFSGHTHMVTVVKGRKMILEGFFFAASSRRSGRIKPTQSLEWKYLLGVEGLFGYQSQRKGPIWSKLCGAGIVGCHGSWLEGHVRVNKKLGTFGNDIASNVTLYDVWCIVENLK